MNRKRKFNDIDDDEDLISKVSDSNIYILNNHIYFSDNISQKSAFQLCKQLRIIETSLKMEAIANKTDPEIYLHITTNGGCISSAFTIIDCMNNLDIPINTVIDGDVSSAGTIISIHGNKRFINKNAYVLIHELRSGCWGKLAYIDDTYKNCIKIQEHINKIYLTKTKITKKMLNNLLVKDVQFNSDETIAMGIADEIYKGQ